MGARGGAREHANNSRIRGYSALWAEQQRREFPLPGRVRVLNGVFHSICRQRRTMHEKNTEARVLRQAYAGRPLHSRYPPPLPPRAPRAARALVLASWLSWLALAGVEPSAGQKASQLAPKLEPTAHAATATRRRFCHHRRSATTPSQNLHPHQLAPTHALSVARH